MGSQRLLCALLLAAALGCEGEAELPPQVDATHEEGAPRASVAPQPLRSGQPRVRDGRVWLQARDEAPERLLFRLSEAAGFALEVGDLDRTPASVDFQGAELAVVLAALARDLPFALEYDVDASTGRHEVVTVRVGFPSEPAPLARVAPAPASPPRPQRGDPPQSAEQARLMRSLDIANTDARRERVEELEPVGAELEALGYVLRNDPDPEIRAIAAETLATADSYGAVRSLVAALEEEDPDVLLEVIEALEFAGDETIIHDLRPLLGHGDRRVRVAAEEAIEFLE